MRVVANGITLEVEDSGAAPDTARDASPAPGCFGVPGMGHDLPPAVVEQILAPLLPHLESVRTVP